MSTMHKNTNRFTELAELFFATRQVIRSKLPHTKVDPNEWMRCETMRFICSTELPPTMLELAKFLRVKAPSATSLVARMEREGFIKKFKQKGDKRVVRIALTLKGEKRVKTYLKDSAAAMEKVFSRISDTDIANLQRILRTLREAHLA